MLKSSWIELCSETPTPYLANKSPQDSQPLIMVHMSFQSISALLTSLLCPHTLWHMRGMGTTTDRLGAANTVYVPCLWDCLCSWSCDNTNSVCWKSVGSGGPSACAPFGGALHTHLPPQESTHTCRRRSRHSTNRSAINVCLSHLLRRWSWPACSNRDNRSAADSPSRGSSFQSPSSG